MTNSFAFEVKVILGLESTQKYFTQPQLQPELRLGLGKKDILRRGLRSEDKLRMQPEGLTVLLLK